MIMNKKSIVSLGIGSIIAFSINVTPAYGTNVTPDDNASLTPIEKTSNELIDFKTNGSHIVIHDPDNERIIEVEVDSNINEELLKYDIDLTQYKTSAGNVIVNTDTVIENQILHLYKTVVSTESETVILEAPVEKQETDDLFIGETKVKAEGKNGEATKTIIVTSNLNPEDETELIEEKLSITVAPEPRIELIGTKKRPTQETQSSNSTSSNSNNSSSHSSNQDSNSTENESKPKAKSYNADTSNNVVNVAMKHVGKKYVNGATGPNSFDCSGFVGYVYGQTGKSLPRTSGSQWNAATEISWNDLKPGDIIWKPGHIGIYIGNNQIIHAANPKRGVVVDPLSWYKNKGYKPGRF